MISRSGRAGELRGEPRMIALDHRSRASSGNGSRLRWAKANAPPSGEMTGSLTGDLPKTSPRCMRLAVDLLNALPLELICYGHDIYLLHARYQENDFPLVGKAEERAVASLFTPGGTHVMKGEFAGTNDFEVVAWLAVLPDAPNAVAG